MRIRPLESPSDLRGVHGVNVLAWRAAYEGLVPEETLDARSPDVPDDALDERFAELDGEEEAFLVAVDDADDVRGYVRVRWDDTKAFVGPDEAGVKEIYVHPDHWNEGVGTRLLERGLAEIPGDVTGVKLEMLAGNELAQSFYTSRGFEHVGSRRAEFSGETLETAIYEKDL